MHAPIEEYEGLLNYVSQYYGTPISPRIIQEGVLLGNLERVYSNALESMTTVITDGKNRVTPTSRKYSMMDFQIEHMDTPKNLCMDRGKVSSKEEVRRNVDVNSPNFMNSLFYLWADINSRNRIKDITSKMEFVPEQKDIEGNPLAVVRPTYGIQTETTMRITTTEPNTQGISTLYKKEFLVPEEGRLLVGGDISSQEAMIFFNGLCRDEEVLRMYRELGEIYKPVVARIEGINPNKVDKDLRSAYKVGILTRMNDGGLNLIGRKMGSMELAVKLDSFIMTNPHYQQFINSVDRQMLTPNPSMGGFIEGRARVITKKDYRSRKQLVNAPLQITGVCFISISMFAFIQRMMADFGHWNTMEEFLVDVRPIYHAHDEILLSVANKNGYPEYAKECLGWALGVQFEDWVPLQAETYVDSKYKH